MSYRVLEVTKQESEQANKVKSEVVCEAMEDEEIDNMTDDDVLSFFFDNDKMSIPKELIEVLEQKVLRCLREHNIKLSK